MWSFGMKNRPLPPELAPDKGLRGRQDFVHQLRRRGLRVHPQQWLSSRSAEQNPRFRSVAVRRRVQKELDAIEIFFLHHPIASQLLRAFVPRPLNRTLLDLLRDMQIASAVEMRTELA